MNQLQTLKEMGEGPKDSELEMDNSPKKVIPEIMELRKFYKL